MIDGRRKGLFAGVAKIYNAVSTQSYGGRLAEQFNAYVLVEGPKSVADSKLELVTEMMSVLDSAISVTTLDLQARDSEPSEKALLRSYAGDPTSNDAMIQAVFGVCAALVDTADSDGGWLFFLPLIPGTLTDLQKARSLISHTVEAFGLAIGYTVNLLPEGQIDLVVSLQFDRHQQSDQAHAALKHLHQSFANEGYAPYRTDIANMPHHGSSSPDAGNTKLIASIKNLLDSRRLVAPGRYIP
jgi:4-cresol dehydrogenase (hydroxylating)